MKIKVTHWKSINLRCPDMEIILNQKNNITFIQMPNGTGKTTLINLIKNTLSNSWADIKPYQDNELLADQGEFELALSYELDNTKSKIVFRTVFDFSNNSIQSFTTTSSNAEIPRFAPDKKLTPYLTEGHISTFAFSGDNMDEYFPNENSDQAKARVEDTIDSFTGVRKLMKLSTDITSNFLKMNHGKVSGTSDALGKDIVKHQQQEKIIKGKIEVQKTQIEITQPIFNQLQEELEQFNELQTKYNKKKEAIDIQVSSAEAAINTHESDLSGQIKNFYSLSENVQNRSQEFLGNLDKAKLPGVAKEFFVELSEKDLCVCNTKIGTHEKKCIIENASDFLGGDDANLINGIKTVNKTRIDTAEVDEFYKEIGNLKACLDDLDDLNQDLATLEEAHRADSGKEYKEKFIRRDRAAEILKDCKKEVAKLTRNPDETTPVVKKLLANQIKSLSGMNSKLEYLESKRAKKEGFEEELEAKNAFLECLERAKVRSKELIREEIKENLNKKIWSSHQDKTFLVDKIDASLHLKSGGGSGGQKVTAVTCFALTMLERSGVAFPLIIDHPVTPIQAESRPMISKMLVDTCEQSICFIINTEKSGFTNKINEPFEFLDHIKNKMNLFTIYRTDRDVKMPANEPDTIYHQSSNCIVSDSHKFFNEFILDQQDS